MDVNVQGEVHKSQGVWLNRRDKTAKCGQGTYRLWLWSLWEVKRKVSINNLHLEQRFIGIFACKSQRCEVEQAERGSISQQEKQRTSSVCAAGPVYSSFTAFYSPARLGITVQRQMNMCLSTIRRERERGGEKKECSNVGSGWGAVGSGTTDGAEGRRLMQQKTRMKNEGQEKIWHRWGGWAGREAVLVDGTGWWSLLSMWHRKNAGRDCESFARPWEIPESRQRWWTCLLICLPHIPLDLRRQLLPNPLKFVRTTTSWPRCELQTAPALSASNHNLSDMFHAQ